MSKQIDEKRISPSLGYQVNPEAFAFLNFISPPRYDMTSAEPLNPKQTGIMPPSKIVNLIRDVDFDDFVEVKGVSKGEPELLNECLRFFVDKGISCDQENVSLNNNILNAIQSVLVHKKAKEDFKVIIPTPTFGYYFHQLAESNIEFVTLPTRPEHGYLPDAAELEQKVIESGAKVLLLCYPNNPTGSVMNSECAHEISEVVKRHDMFVISDEAFISNSLSDKKHFPIAAVEGMVEKSFTVTSSGKSIFTGRKSGFCVGPKDLVTIFERLGGYPTKQDQKILAASIEDSEENKRYLEACRQYYLENIEIVKAGISNLNSELNQKFGTEDFVYVKPEVLAPNSANVYLLNFSGLAGKLHGDNVMRTGLDVAKWLLNDASVGTVPGECFLFDEKDMIVRISLNHSHERMAEAFSSISNAISSIISPLNSAQLVGGQKLSEGRILSSDHVVDC